MKPQTQVGSFQDQQRNRQQMFVNSDRDEEVCIVHSERDENELNAMVDDDTAQRPITMDCAFQRPDFLPGRQVPPSDVHVSRIAEAMHLNDLSRQNNTLSQLDRALETPKPHRFGPGLPDPTQQRSLRTGIPANLSCSIESQNSIVGGVMDAQSRIKDLKERNEKLLQELLLRNQRMLVECSEIRSAGRLEDEERLSDF